ncbi:GTPase Era [Buchnera aphidicola (Chaitoregma tattakana)]|uniref:GTPase Era n=1 Tax=Buchnera aphidicola TaxID=9 RepID=UPI0031B8340C
MKNMFCGTILIVGKTNVGKSTLFNKLIKKRISIVSNRKNTTEKYIVGVRNNFNKQSIFIDTPGIFKFKLNKKFHVCKKKFYVDLIILVIDRNIWKQEDENILISLNNTKVPIILLINKIDKIKDKSVLLPFLKYIHKKYKFFKLIPSSSNKKNNIKKIRAIVEKKLPHRKHIFKKNFVTYNTKQFIVSEIVRERFLHYFSQEIPYKLKIEIESIKELKAKILFIKAIIKTKNNRHKKIVIGNKGNMIKKCNITSRKKIEMFFKKKVHLYFTVQTI